MSIEAMKQALEALESDNPDIQLRAAIALRQAIAQAEQAPICAHGVRKNKCDFCKQAEQAQPVAWISHSDSLLSWDKFYDHMEPLYTNPTQRKPLTDEEIRDLYGDNNNFDITGPYVIAFARAIEAAHGIKGEA